MGVITTAIGHSAATHAAATSRRLHGHQLAFLQTVMVVEAVMQVVVVLLVLRPPQLDDVD